MYISRVEIDITNRKKIKELSHLGAFHNWVERSFTEKFDSNNRVRNLWRIDKLNDKNYLIVISPEKPDLKCLEEYGVENSAETKSYDKFLNSIKKGNRMKFRVILNPVISKSKGKGNKSEVKPHITIEHQIKYLTERSLKNGFSLNENEFSIVERGCEIFKKKDQKTIKFVKAVYEGILTIEDVDIFKKTLIKGFGKHKAYGFGMITVIPVVN